MNSIGITMGSYRENVFFSNSSNISSFCQPLWTIHQFLNFNENATMEEVCHRCLLNVRAYWKILGENSYTFPWREVQLLKNPEKWNFLLTAALIDIINKRTFIQSQLIGASFVRKKYSHLSEFSKSFKYFTIEWFRPELDRDRGDVLEEKNKIIIEALNNENPSDVLLFSLLESIGSFLPITPTDQLLEMIKRAIKKGVTCIPLLLWLIKKNEFSPKQIEELALEAAFNRDYRALDLLLNSYSLNDLVRLNVEHPSLPPVLFYLSFHELDLSEQESLLQQALFGYQEKVPPIVLIELGRNMMKQGQFQKADEYFLKAILKWFPRPIAPEIWVDMAVVKSYLGNFELADRFYSYALGGFRGQAQAEIVAHAAFIKLQLKDFRHADQLFTEALHKFKQKDIRISARILADAAFTKMKKGDFRESDRLYVKAKAEYGQEAPPYFLSDAAFVKIKNNQYKASEVLIDQAIEKFKALEKATGEKIPAWFFAHAAYIKFLNKKYRFADELYTKALVAKGAPAQVFINAGIVKCKCGDYRAANQLFNLANETIKNNPEPGKKTLTRLMIWQSKAKKGNNSFMQDSSIGN